MKSSRIVFGLLLLFVPSLAFAHGGHKHVIGTVSSVSSKLLVVTTTSGAVSVPLTNTTRFYHGSGTAALLLWRFFTTGGLRMVKMMDKMPEESEHGNHAHDH